MARSFNGTSDTVIAPMTGVTFAYPITYAAWINFSAFAHDSAVVTLGSSTNINTPYSQLSTQHSSGFAGIFISNGVFATQAVGSVTLTVGTWFHLAGTVSSDGKTVVIYTNGGNKTTGTNANGQSLVWSGGNPDHVGIGCVDLQTGPQNFFAGSIADVAIWSVVLSDAEIAALAAGARPYTVRPGTLFGYWPLDGIASTEPDLGGFKDNGTVTGTAKSAGPPVMQFTPRWNQFNSIAAPFKPLPPFSLKAA